MPQRKPRQEASLRGELSYYIRKLIRERNLDFTVKEEYGRSDLPIFAGTTPLINIEVKDPDIKILDSALVNREFNRARENNFLAVSLVNFFEVLFYDLRGVCSVGECESGLNLVERCGLSQLDINQYKHGNKITDKLKQALEEIAKFLVDIAEKIHTRKQIKYHTPDEKFIFRVKAILYGHLYDFSPIVERAESDYEVREAVNEFCQKEYWTIPHTEEEYERFVYLCLLDFMVKLVFYEVFYFSSEYKGRVPRLVIPEHLSEPSEVLSYLYNECFLPLMEETGNYEEVFGRRNDPIYRLLERFEGIRDFAEKVIKTCELYDFTKIDADVLGKIFEGLIREDERHKLGQYFTPSAVIRLINAFCIRSGQEIVLDPTCGSGSFLVHAYHRKKALTGQRHNEILKALYGYDVSSYACYLSAVNLASRDFRYSTKPNIKKTDFFEVPAQQSFDAVVGNPPYTRQEELEDIIEKQKERYAGKVLSVWGFQPNLKTSLHVLVLYYAGAFLKESGRLGFVLSNSWMQTDYGQQTIKWLKENFKIVALIESAVERFFPDAEVDVCILLIEKSKPEPDHLVKFVLLKTRLEDVLMQVDEDRLINLIETTSEHTEEQLLRIISIPQKELPDSSWGRIFRQGPAYKKLKTLFKDWVRFGEYVEVRRGITTGDNDFFYLESVEDESSIHHAKNYKGGYDPERLILCQNGYGDLWLIEKEFFRPLLKSPRYFEEEEEGWVYTGEDLCLMVSAKTDLSKYPYLSAYIKWGEEKGVSAKESVRSRSPWYSLPWEEGYDFALQVNVDKDMVIFPLANFLEYVVDKMFYLIKVKDTSKKQIVWDFLNSEVFRYLFELNAIVMGGGAAYLTTEMLEDLYVPKLEDLPSYLDENLRNKLAEEIKTLVQIRTQRAKSVPNNKKKKNRIKVEVLLQELQKRISEKSINVEKTPIFYHLLMATAKEITRDAKLVKKLVGAFWRNHFNEDLLKKNDITSWQRRLL